MLVRSKAVAFFCLITVTALMPSEAMADGPLVRLFPRRTIEQATRPLLQPNHQAGSVGSTGTTSANQSANSGTSRLPSGRNYYQGRYYGNFNNRFYGPQYGYF